MSRRNPNPLLKESDMFASRILRFWTVFAAACTTAAAAEPAGIKLPGAVKRGS